MNDRAKSDEGPNFCPLSRFVSDHDRALQNMVAAGEMRRYDFLVGLFPETSWRNIFEWFSAGCSTSQHTHTHTCRRYLLSVHVRCSMRQESTAHTLTNEMVRTSNSRRGCSSVLYVGDDNVRRAGLTPPRKRRAPIPLSKAPPPPPPPAHSY